MTGLGTGALAFRDVPFEAELEPAPSVALGTERTLALTATSTFGTVYETSPLIVVIHGSVTAHESMR